MDSTNPTQGNSTLEFRPFPKIPRLNREVTITEKIDGTSGCIFIDETGTIFKAGSRNRWLTLESDNFGFYKWAHDNKTELLKLGPGRHFGEWFGAGIQRGYGLKEKRFALFNASRWTDPKVTGRLETLNDIELCDIELCPDCCAVVPVLYRGIFSTFFIEDALRMLANDGSAAVPGFMNPEGIVIYHHAANQFFKKTIFGDEKPKGSNE